jgi:hypothetical protein
MRPLVINFAIFQLGWFACVLGAAAGFPWVGASITSGLIALHLAIVSQPGRDLRLMAVAAGFGFLADTLLTLPGLMQFAGGDASSLIAPPWMVVLWINFAITLRHSLAWLQSRRKLAVLLGAVAGPLAYLAGERLGALQVPEPFSGYAAIGVTWAVALPCLLFFARRVERPAADAIVATGG